MIIETSSNQFFQVKDATISNGQVLDHAWLGFAVKRVKGVWVPKAGAREMLVRKAATRIVEA